MIGSVEKPTLKAVRPSLLFWVSVLALTVLGVALLDVERRGVWLFSFVLMGWLFSLTLHEFGHAIVAYFSGDHTVRDKGYLTLDIRHYADLGGSIIFPVLILIIGGLGLPGGAVWINLGLIRSKFARSLVSLAGPIMTGLCALICLLPIRLGFIGFEQHLMLAIALGFLGWIQVVALILNMLPIPGLDGFGVIEPFLPAGVINAVAPFRRHAFMILIALMLFSPDFGRLFWGWSESLTVLIGGKGVPLLKELGWAEFRFWRS